MLRVVPFCLHAVANTPAGLMKLIRSYHSISFGLPRYRGGSAPALTVSRPAQRSLTLRPARSPSRLATLCTRGFSSFVASTAALIATGWSEPVPGRVYSRCGPPPFHGAPGNPVCQDYSARSRFIILEVDTFWKTIIWQQFGAALDMLENAIQACPDALWSDQSKRPEWVSKNVVGFWYVAPRWVAKAKS